jgi:hypothetical protein
MAKAKSTNSVTTFRAKPKRKRPGVHSKNKNSKSKHSKHYKKSYVGQGR